MHRIVPMAKEVGTRDLIWPVVDTLFVLQQTTEALIAVASFLGNALVLYVIYRYRQLRTTPNYLIASLATADFLVGTLGIPCVIVNNFMLPRNLTGCLIMSSVIIALTQISIFGLTSIAMERLLAIKFPYLHREKLTNTFLSTIIISCWTLGFLVGFVPVFGWHRGPLPQNLCIFNILVDMNYMIYFNFIGFVLSPLLCILIIYVHIFMIIRKRNNLVGTGDDENVEQASNGNNAPRLQNVVDESKVAKHIFGIILVSYIAWLPLHVLNMVYLYTGYLNRILIICGILLSHVNSALNPILYARGNHKFRDAMKRTLRFKFKESTSGGQGTVNDHR